MLIKFFAKFLLNNKECQLDRLDRDIHKVITEASLIGVLDIIRILELKYEYKYENIRVHKINPRLKKLRKSGFIKKQQLLVAGGYKCDFYSFRKQLL